MIARFLAKPAVLSVLVYGSIALLTLVVLAVVWGMQYFCHNHFAPLILGNNDPVAIATYCRRS